MAGGEDCLNEVSSAAAPDAALRPKEASIWLPQFAKPLKWQAKCDGSGVAFSFPYFFWLSKRNRVANKAKKDSSNSLLPLTPTPLPPAGDGLKRILCNPHGY